MKVVIQIPCYNEANTLPLVLNSIPKSIAGVDELVVLIIDDGSSDDTVKIAKQHGVTHFVLHPGNQGLAHSFNDGMRYALSIGADILVNTDGDNQYPQADIPKLIAPIIAGKADMVIADRQTAKIAHFSPSKKLFQRFGTWILNKAATTNVPDAPSGFRAYSREAMYKLNIVTHFSYAMETLVQAGHKQLSIASVQVVTNPKTRESRLFKSNWEHMVKSGTAIARSFVMYRPYLLFVPLGLSLLALALIPFVRYLYFFATDAHGNHIQSLLLGSVLFSAAFISLTLGVIADLIRINRALAEQTLELQKRHYFKQ